ncbi:MAG: hypothetical protein IKD69_12525 [Solobacterium sp.]|nr:hypothetical protein [Solobacterium sp.]
MANASIDFTLHCSMSTVWNLLSDEREMTFRTGIYHTLQNRAFYDRLEYMIENDTLKGKRVILFMEERGGVRIAVMDECSAKKLTAAPLLGRTLQKQLDDFQYRLRKEIG